MKWFKHYSDNYRGRSVLSFHREFGHVGVSWYYLLTEICAEKLDKPLHGDITTASCAFSFDKAFVELSLRGTFAKIERWLRHGVVMGLWSFTTTDHELRLNYPILLELLDSDQRKTRSRRDRDATQTLLDKEQDKEKEKEVDKNKSFAPTQFSADAEKLSKSKKALTSEQKDLNKRIWESYRSAYLIRWKVEPVRNQTVNGQISMLRSRLGDEAVEVVAFYLTSNNTFYVGKCHPIGLCLQDAEALRTQMLKGTAITSSMLKNFEKKIQSNERDEQIRNMWKDE